MASRQSTTEDISGWLTPRQTLDILEAAFPDRHSALTELQERLRGGVVIAACRTTSIDGRPVRAGVLNQIGAEDWEKAYADDEVWTSGTLSIRGGYRESGGYNSPKDIRFFDVRFNPAHINDILAPHQRPAPQPDPSPTRNLPPSNLVETKINIGGRPPKQFWQDLWVEMCCQIYEGDIQPDTTQAAILERMQQWVSDHDYEAGETVLKDAAQKLARALKARSET